MLKINSFLVSPESFPPYRYVRQYVPDLLERYDDLLNENLDCPKFDFLYVHICGNSYVQKLSDINEIISTQARDSVKYIAEDNFETLETFLDNFKKTFSPDVSVVVISEDCVAQDEVGLLHDRYKNTLFVLIDADKKTAADANPTVITSSEVNVSRDIGDLLERLVLRSIKSKCETLGLLLKKKKLLDEANKYVEDRMKAPANREERKRKHSIEDPENGKKSFRANNEKFSKVVNEEFSRYPAGELYGCPQMSNAYQQSSPANGTEQDYAFATCSRENYNGERRISDLKCKELQDVARDTIESLIAEMTALFRTSNVPEHEKPNIMCGQETEINKKMKLELFKAVPTIERMGYRFSKLVVYVGNAAVSRNDKEREAIKRKIQEVLSNFDIKDFTAEFISGITNYCDVDVGAKIRFTADTGESISGTLGCFANMRDHEVNNTCALISGHVARGRDCFCVYSETTDSFHVLGDVINETVPDNGLIDIAALKLKSGIKICAKFRKEQDNLGNKDSIRLPGKLQEISDNRCTDGLKCGQYVYLWGALSKPGKGVVTMRSEGMDDSLIQIEDRRAKKGETSVPFCKPGDSGAVVCAEDRSGKFVHVISMLIGEMGSRDENTEQTVRQYLSVPLCDGLRELARRTGCSFEICEYKNDM